MSRFCGKCDFYDHLCIHCDSEEKIEELLSKSDIYITTKDGREHKLKIETIKDAAKYYPYLICVGTFSKEGHTIVLSSESFIDREERDSLRFDIENVLKYWRKCKREKRRFDKDECYNKIHWHITNDDYLKEIIKRVAEKGNNAEFDDIHKPMWERYRKDWFDEMVNLGYSEFDAFRWCFNEYWPLEDKIRERLGRVINED